jgi:small-conductance mechanosensitive channel
VSGIHWIGLTEQNLQQAALSAFLFGALWLIRRIVRLGLRAFVRGESRRAVVARFWGHQAINVGSFGLAVFALASIWFDDPARLATAFGLVGAGLAFALQRVITAFAGYIVILNSGLFAVGDRINMGGVRGDVLTLGFMQTTLMEMGVAPGSDAGPAVWVKSRQFTGRIVAVSNAKIFEDPVYNYTRDFPYIWEEVRLPIRTATTGSAPRRSCSKRRAGTRSTRRRSRSRPPTRSSAARPAPARFRAAHLLRPD